MLENGRAEHRPRQMPDGHMFYVLGVAIAMFLRAGRPQTKHIIAPEGPLMMRRPAQMRAQAERFAGSVLRSLAWCFLACAWCGRRLNKSHGQWTSCRLSPACLNVVAVWEAAVRRLDLRGSPKRRSLSSMPRRHEYLRAPSLAAAIQPSFSLSGPQPVPARSTLSLQVP